MVDAGAGGVERGSSEGWAGLRCHWVQGNDICNVQAVRLFIAASDEVYVNERRGYSIDGQISGGLTRVLGVSVCIGVNEWMILTTSFPRLISELRAARPPAVSRLAR